jgi:hypothetical protein
LGAVITRLADARWAEVRSAVLFACGFGLSAERSPHTEGAGSAAAPSNKQSNHDVGTE